MANYLGFFDETGVLTRDPNQRFFGLGLLKLKDTAPFYDELVKLKDKITSELTRLHKPFEFKFNEINRTNHTFYHDLIDLYFSFPDTHFCALVIDKFTPTFNMRKYFFRDTWEAYIGYSKLLIKRNIKHPDTICVLADYLSKPNFSTKYYEVEIIHLKEDGFSLVYNACMLESHASLYIQVVDVLVGSVAYAFRCETDKGFKPNEFKKRISDLVKNKLKVETLAQDITVYKPSYFSVWLFKPK